MGASIVTRPPELCTDSALFEDVLEHAYHQIKNSSISSNIVVLMCNAVTVNASLIDSAIEKLEKDPKADSAVTVSIFNMYSPLCSKTSEGYLEPFVPLVHLVIRKH